MLYSDVLLTVDFDRTLTAPDSTIPQRNIEAIQYFMDNGGAFTVNTGRSIPMCHFLDKVPVNAPLLIYTGSAAYDPNTKELSLCRPIELDRREVLEHLQQKFPQLTVEVQGIDAHYIFRKDPGWEAFSEYNNCPWGYKEPEDIPGPFLKFSLYGQFREVTMASMYEGPEWELKLCDEAMAYIQERYGDAVDVFRACPRIIDVHAKGVSKIAAARGLQESLGRSILVCVGDGENDLPMLSGADYAFCPSDGIIADRFVNVCPCAEGAVANVIYEKIPEILKNRS